jgi:hypothetical protein
VAASDIERIVAAVRDTLAETAGPLGTTRQADPAVAAR